MFQGAGRSQMWIKKSADITAVSFVFSMGLNLLRYYWVGTKERGVRLRGCEIKKNLKSVINDVVRKVFEFGFNAFRGLDLLYVGVFQVSIPASRSKR